ncbi:MAG: hypothetical protein D6812_02740, partial [Deltaproteobacteria bacterium]
MRSVLENEETRLEAYDYELPETLIAAYPRQRREESRLMVLHRAEARIECTTFQRI